MQQLARKRLAASISGFARTRECDSWRAYVHSIRCLDRFPDKRRGINTTYGMGDIGMAAFPVFFMQSPSFLAHQRQFEEAHGRSNCASLFGITKIPSDNHIRDMLDPASPALLHSAFAETVAQLQRIDGGLDVFRRLDGRVLIALDGTEYHCSRKIHCPHCSTRVRGNGGKEYYHSMLAATQVAPGHDKVVPLDPEFVVPRDGAEKQDCENGVAKRWLATHGQRYAALDPVYLGPVYFGDDLFSRQPLCQAVSDAGGHFIFVCKPSSHPLIQEYLTGAAVPVLEQTVRRGKQRFVHRYRWLRNVPLRDGPRAQLRTREAEPRSHPGEPELAGLRHARRLRHRRRALAQRTNQARASLQLLQQARSDHHLPDLPVLG